MMLTTSTSDFDNNVANQFKIFEYYDVYNSDNSNSIRGPTGQLYSRSGMAGTGNVRFGGTRNYLDNGYNTGNNFSGSQPSGDTWTYPGIEKNVFATEFTYSYIAGIGPTQSSYYQLRRGPVVSNCSVGRGSCSTFWWNPNYIRTEVTSSLYDDTLSPLSDFVIDKMGDASITPPSNYSVRAFITWDRYVLYATRYYPGGYPGGGGSSGFRYIVDVDSPVLAYVSNFIVLK